VSELGRGLQLLQYYRCTDLVWPFDFRQLRPDRADSRLHDSLERSEEAKPSQAKLKPKLSRGHLRSSLFVAASDNSVNRESKLDYLL
jgi:hypothetical protein